MEAELRVGGARVWVGLAACAEKGVFPGKPCALLVCCALPNRKALLGTPLPGPITICHAISIVISHRDTQSVQ